MNARRRFLILAISVILVGCNTLWGQERSAQLIIRVTDTSGAVVPRAEVRVLPKPNTVPDNPETNEYGTLALSVPPGNYELFVSFPWFTPWGNKIQVHQDKSEKIAVVLDNPGDETIVRVDTPTSPMVLNPTHAPAQPTPVSVVIEVSDQTGAAVPFAQVWVAREQRETDERGTLHLNLIPDAYYVTVTSPSFKRWRERIQIHSRTAAIRVALTKMDVHKLGAE